MKRTRAKPHKPIEVSNRVLLLDALMDLGGEIEQAGRNVGKSAALFPATRGWIVEDLECLKGLCERWIERLNAAHAAEREAK